MVEERDGYSIVEKIGHAGEIAEALDERNEDVDESMARLKASDEPLG